MSKAARSLVGQGDEGADYSFAATWISHTGFFCSARSGFALEGEQLRFNPEIGAGLTERSPSTP